VPPWSSWGRHEQPAGPLGLAREAAERALAALAAAPRDEVWISRFAPEKILARADRVDDDLGAGADLPLAGLTFAVKDNIDVAGLATTAGCPAFSYAPAVDAPAVRALLSAGALCLGKTNLDQFATGLVGTRSPYGAVRNAVDPDRISGGSSSGSAVAVALGQVDLALGTDTAGSGRVPAALNGIVGLKATYGLVSTEGVVPACRSFDCVTVFAPDVTLAERAMAELTGPRGQAGDRRGFPPDSPLGPPGTPVVARPAGPVLDDLEPSRRDAYEAALLRLEASGCLVVEIDLEPFFDAGRLLYQGAFVAERYAAVGAWIAAHPDAVDPTVGAIILGARDIPAERLAADTGRLAELQQTVREEWARVGAHSLLLPTTPTHPTIAEVLADPIGTNTRLGTYTTFLNLLDQCAVAVPFGLCAGLPFGVSCIGPAFTDLVQIDLARRLERAGRAAEHGSATRTGDWRTSASGHLAPPGLPLAVVGAHLSGQPLNHQLTERGGRLLGPAATAAAYRLFALDTVPAKPGLIRVSSGGQPIALEIWELPPAGFASFVAALPSPMAIGSLLLEDGSSVAGFLCEPVATEGATDITVHGGWRAYLAAGSPG
jgi:allophanate hydrolase